MRSNKAKICISNGITISVFNEVNTYFNSKK